MPTLSIDLRPKTFDEVVGLNEVVQAIKNQIASGRIPLAWMFYGPSGCGKTTLARILASYIQGESFYSNTTPELIEINASDLNGVEAARELVKTATYYPIEGKYKIVILDEVQRMTKDGQNVLLKSFEDSATTIWILCTTEPEKIMKTLRGRCLQFAVRPLNEQEITDLFNRVHTYTGYSKATVDLKMALIKYEVREPRNILMALEKFMAGASVEASIHQPSQRPESFSIARTVCTGNWKAASELIKDLLKTIEEAEESKLSIAKELRAITAGYLRSMILTSNKANEASEALLGLVQYSSNEELALSGTVASLYRVSKKMGG